MVEKFDPAPFDKYAEHPNSSAIKDRAMSDKLSSGLVGSFPASDPPSISQPPASKHDTREGQTVSLWKRITSILDNG
jgi:hypothetical protein